MVKGISRQVIVVQSPEPKMFEQAIFILKDEALGEGIVASPGLRAQTPELQELPCERITGPEVPRNQNIGPRRWFKSRWRGYIIPN